MKVCMNNIHFCISMQKDYRGMWLWITSFDINFVLLHSPSQRQIHVYQRCKTQVLDENAQRAITPSVDRVKGICVRNLVAIQSKTCCSEEKLRLNYQKNLEYLTPLRFLLCEYKEHKKTKHRSILFSNFYIIFFHI